MKPTKDQLESIEWWDANSDGFDFLYECESTGEIVFANREGKDANGLRLRLELAIWKLLAKRPEPEWVPEVGVECCGNTTDAAGIWSWQKVEPLKDMGNGEFACYTEKKILRVVDQFRPIKTQREELIDLIYMSSEIALDAAAATASIILGKYDLTEKDVE